MTLLSDLDDFGRDHRPHGTLAATAGDITPHGYRLEMRCPCGVTFERWVSPDDAAENLAVLALLT